MGWDEFLIHKNGKSALFFNMLLAKPMDYDPLLPAHTSSLSLSLIKHISILSSSQHIITWLKYLSLSLHNKAKINLSLISHYIMKHISILSSS